MAESAGPILHVIVIGFHHKKGCQVRNQNQINNNLFLKCGQLLLSNLEEVRCYNLLS